MVFNSTTFLIFLAVFFVVYAICPAKYRYLMLLAGSAVFCAIDGIAGLITALGFACANYLLGIFVQSDKRRNCTTWCTVGVLLDAGLLITVKLLAKTGVIDAAPTGISYYTFAGIAYLVDISRDTINCESNLLKYADSVILFPKYVQGPIIRYGEIERDLTAPRTTARRLQEGLELFILGFCMKVLIADRLGVLWNQDIYNSIPQVGVANISTKLAWLGAYAYSIQIYVDWQGYMLMAIGVGKMLGIELPPNFDFPYLAKSVGDFFRRWHITLTRWFKDYIYIPLGGNRCGTGRTVFNILFVWLLTSLWHGISWNFLIWGMSIGILIVLEKLVWGKALDKLHVLPHLYVLFLIPLTWVCFNTSISADLGRYFLRLFPFLTSEAPLIPEAAMQEVFMTNLTRFWPYLLAGAVFCTPLPEKLIKKFSGSLILSVILTAAFWIAVYICIAAGASKSMYANF